MYLLPIEIFDAVKRRLTGIQSNESIPVIGVISNDAFVGHFFDIYHKPATTINERIGIMGVLQDESELIDQLGHPGL